MNIKTKPPSDYVEIRVSRHWLRFIKWIAAVVPNGKVPIQFVGGQPIKLYGKPEPDIRFDKETAVPTALDFEFNPEEDS